MPLPNACPQCGAGIVTTPTRITCEANKWAMGGDCRWEEPLPDLRETLDPRWQALKETRDRLVWDIRWEERWGHKEGQAEEKLLAWEATNADEWNKLRPWFAPRLNRWGSIHKSMTERCAEKQMP